MSKTISWLDSGIGIDLPDGRSLLGTVLAEDADVRKLIVKAVNNHDVLIKALQFYASEWQPNGEDDPETPGLSRSWIEPTDELQNDGGRKAREALAKVSSCPKK